MTPCRDSSKRLRNFFSDSRSAWVRSAILRSSDWLSSWISSSACLRTVLSSCTQTTSMSCCVAGSTTGNIVELIQRTLFAGRPSPMRISKGIGGRLTTSPAKARSMKPPSPAALSCGSVRMLKSPMSSATSAKSVRNAAFTRRVVPSGAKIWMLIGACSKSLLQRDSETRRSSSMRLLCSMLRVVVRISVAPAIGQGGGNHVHPCDAAVEAFHQPLEAMAAIPHRQVDGLARDIGRAASVGLELGSHIGWRAT